MKLRIAFRVEGDFWNAYIANEKGLEDAALLGSVLYNAAILSPSLKKKFMECMQECFNEILKANTGHSVVEWETKKAPENERSGSA